MGRNDIMELKCDCGNKGELKAKETELFNNVFSISNFEIMPTRDQTVDIVCCKCGKRVEIF